MMPHTDIKKTWVDQLLPPPVRPYAKLARLDRPIGTWLLLFPCWWSVALASGNQIDWKLFTLLAIGAIVMRGAGCTLNDILDRHLDARVERTRHRPIPGGHVSVWQALTFLGAQMLLGLVVLLQFNNFTILLGMSSLILVAVYPLMKRITWWPQAFLGITFNWGALVGWSAVHGRIEWPAIILYIAGFFWTLGYDTIYAHQDKEDDARIGIKSTALLFEDNSRLWIMGFYASLLACFIMIGVGMHLGFGFYVGMAAAAAHLVWQVTFWIVPDPRDSLAKFRASRWTGWIILIAILMG